MKARLASEADLPGLLTIAESFIAESAFGWTYSREASEKTYRLWMAHPEADVIVVEDGAGATVAAAGVTFAQDFCVEREGYVLKLYVLPEARGTRAARILVEAIDTWFQANGCRTGFATATANIGPLAAKQFVNLFRKFGFTPVPGCEAVMKEFP